MTCLRFGLSERLLDAVLAHLGGRTVGDAKLLHQQMVKGGVTEAVIEQLEIETMLTGATPATSTTAPWPADAQIAESTGCCYGARRRRFPGGRSGQVARVSELIADVYFGPARAGEHGGTA